MDYDFAVARSADPSDIERVRPEDASNAILGLVGQMARFRKYADEVWDDNAESPPPWVTQGWFGCKVDIPSHLGWLRSISGLLEETQGELKLVAQAVHDSFQPWPSDVEGLTAHTAELKRSAEIWNRDASSMAANCFNEDPDVEKRLALVNRSAGDALRELCRGLENVIAGVDGRVKGMALPVRPNGIDAVLKHPVYRVAKELKSWF